MPQQYTAYEPDQLDCEVMCRALGADFNVLPIIETTYTRDQVWTIVRCRTVTGGTDGEIRVQSLVKSPLRSARSLYAVQYSALLDCWHQLDRGVLAAAERPVRRDWTGRPRQPERRK